MIKIPVSFVMVLFVLCGCYTEHKIEANTAHQIEVKPIHITVDINLKVDKALDDFFSDIDESETEEEPNA